MEFGTGRLSACANKESPETCGQTCISKANVGALRAPLRLFSFLQQPSLATCVKAVHKLTPSPTLSHPPLLLFRRAATQVTNQKLSVMVRRSNEPLSDDSSSATAMAAGLESGRGSGSGSGSSNEVEQLLQKYVMATLRLAEQEQLIAELRHPRGCCSCHHGGLPPCTLVAGAAAAADGGLSMQPEVLGTGDRGGKATEAGGLLSSIPWKLPAWWVSPEGQHSSARSAMR